MYNLFEQIKIYKVEWKKQLDQFIFKNLINKWTQRINKHYY